MISATNTDFALNAAPIAINPTNDGRISLPEDIWKHVKTYLLFPIDANISNFIKYINFCAPSHLPNCVFVELQHLKQRMDGPVNRIQFTKNLSGELIAKLRSYVTYDRYLDNINYIWDHRLASIPDHWVPSIIPWITHVTKYTTTNSVVFTQIGSASLHRQLTSEYMSLKKRGLACVIREIIHKKNIYTTLTTPSLETCLRLLNNLGRYDAYGFAQANRFGGYPGSNLNISM